MENIEENIKLLIKDSTIEGLIEIIKNLSTDIDKYYITRKEHRKIIEDIRKEYENKNKWNKSKLRF